MYDKEIKSLEGNVDNLQNNLNQLITYKDVFDVVQDLNNRADYIGKLTKLKDESTDLEKKKFITDLLKLNRHFSGEQKLTKEDIDKINNQHAFTVAHILDKFNKTIDDLIKKESDAFGTKSKIEKLVDRSHQIQEIDKQIDRLNLLQEAFDREETSFVKEPPFVVTAEDINTDVGVIPEERRSDKEPTKKVFKPGCILTKVKY